MYRDTPNIGVRLQVRCGLVVASAAIIVVASLEAPEIGVTASPDRRAGKHRVRQQAR